MTNNNKPNIKSKIVTIKKHHNEQAINRIPKSKTNKDLPKPNLKFQQPNITTYKPSLLLGL